jgi:transposase
MANRPAAPLDMTVEQRAELERIARSSSRPHREVRHAKGLLLAADGVANSVIAERVGVGRGTVLAWRARFEADGVERIGKVAKGRGRKPSIPQETIERIVHDTLHTTPESATHWSCRSMAAHSGISKAIRSYGQRTHRRSWTRIPMKCQPSNVIVLARWDDARSPAEPSI